MKKLLVSIAALSLLLTTAIAYSTAAYGKQSIMDTLTSTAPAGIIVAAATTAAVLISARIDDGETNN